MNQTTTPAQLHDLFATAIAADYADITDADLGRVASEHLAHWRTMGYDVDHLAAEQVAEYIRTEYL